MSITGTIQKVASVGGLSIQSTIQRSSNSQIGHDWNLAAAVAGTLTTRTDNTSGVLTLAPNHGIANTDVFDLFWLNTGVPQCAYGCIAADVSGNSVGFSGAAGDILPAANYAVNASEVSLKDTDFDGDLLEMIAINASVAAHITFRDAGAAVIMARTLVGNEAWEWISNQGIANPLTGNAVADCRISGGNATAGGTMKMGLIYNSGA